MTEADWFAATDAIGMLRSLDGKISERKLRLLCCACCRAAWHVLTDERSRRAVEVAERYADETASRQELDLAREAAAEAAREVSDRMVERFPDGLVEGAEYRAGCRAEQAACDACETANVDIERLGNIVWSDGVAGQALFLRDIIGNPFRPVAISPASLTPQVIALAQATYGERHLSSGHLEPSRLAVLADALEEAGVGEGGLLDHLHDPGPHVRGCHALDLLLGRE